MTKQGDTNSITFTVKGTDGQPVDFTGSTVQVLAKPSRGGDAVELAVTPGPSAGTLVHQLTGTLAADTYDVVVKETKSGVKTTAPGNGYYHLIIEPNIG